MFNKILGSLIGGAVGDALGYEVEFSTYEEIKYRFGKDGIKDYVLHNNKAFISDDTQMTLFTLNGILYAKTNNIPYTEGIRLAYLDWYETQSQSSHYAVKPKASWIANFQDLYSLRAPGGTCLSACMKGANGTIEEPINDSKGCGGVMRVAPIGLFFNNNNVARLGAETAALTHGHDLGYLPAAFLAHMLHCIAYKNMTILESVQDAKKAVCSEFEHGTTNMKKLLNIEMLMDLVDKAIELSKENMNDVDAINKLGQGWVAEETLAIAIYCSLKYSDDFEKAIVASVNHSGDSDSTGAVCGNIMGAYLGYDKIPLRYTANLELKDLIYELALDLYMASINKEDVSKDWTQKYVEKTYSELTSSLKLWKILRKLKCNKNQKNIYNT